MILEVEYAIDRVQEAIGRALVEAAVQIPPDVLFPGNEVATTVVPSQADGDLVCIDGIIDVHELARIIVEDLGLGRAS